MKGKLNKKQVDYIFYHLEMLFEADLNLFEYKYQNSRIEINKTIKFPLSDEVLDLNNTLHLNNIPILFPTNVKTNTHYNINNNELEFHHDILKSAFYLLSAYQEYTFHKQNPGVRYPYDLSVQSKLNIVEKPLVNYYFEIIISALEEYCNGNNITFKRKKIFDNFGFQLSHDIDRIDKYHFWEVCLKIKQMIGLSESPFGFIKRIKQTAKYIFNYIFFKNKKNDFWNFGFLMEIEQRLNLPAIYFFLQKWGLHDNSRYSFNEKRIQKLFRNLKTSKSEIGLHGTTFSFSSLENLKINLKAITDAVGQQVIGNRFHYLNFQTPKTMSVLYDAGIKYDTTLAFAEHEGFRNSYCLPFKLYDFEKDQIIDVWEFPLIVMDGTWFFYRKLNYNQMKESMINLISEIKKFNGIFSLLWHNSHFDEDEFPGITRFYQELLEEISKMNPNSITGKELVKKLNLFLD